MAIVRNTIKFSSGGGSDIIVVANYSALPDPTTVSGQFYWCSVSQGTSWLPGSLGGTYYNSGMYYSNGTTWEFINVPYQATQAEVNTGTNTDKFVTPETLKNQNYLATIAYADAKVEDTIVDGVTDKAPSQNSVFDALELKLDNSAWSNYGATSTINGFSVITTRNIWYKPFQDGTLFNVDISGTSTNNTFTFTIPITPNISTQLPCGQGTSNGTISNTVALAIITSGSTTIDLRATPQGSTWGVANGKAFKGQFFIKN